MSMDDASSNTHISNFLKRVHSSKKPTSDAPKNNTISVNCCSADEIFFILDNKEFSLYGSPLHSLFLKETSISASAKILWLTLWELVRFDDSLFIIISIKSLAAHAGISQTSTKKYLNELEINNFLLRQRNIEKTNSTTSRIGPRYPAIYFEMAKHAKDRAKNKHK